MKMATGDNAADRTALVKEHQQLALVKENEDESISYMLRVLFSEVSPASNSLEPSFSSDINKIASSTSNQVETQASLSGKGKAPITSPELHEDLRFPSDINNIASTSYQVESHEASLSGKVVISDQVERHEASLSGKGKAPITPPYMNTEVHEDLCHEWRENSGSAGEDLDASNEIIKKIRMKPEVSSEGQNGRCCNCKMSNCLKLYCECFRAGVYCQGPCSCRECFNTREHDETVQYKREKIGTRNPFAFAAKNLASTKEKQENSATVSAAQPRKGCNCKKSKCSKKYCECFQAQLGCSDFCQCEDCQNSFGTKTENARSGELKLPHESLYATENIPQYMNTGSTPLLPAYSLQPSSYPHQVLPWRGRDDTSNLQMPLMSQPHHDGAAYSSEWNWGGFTGDQIQEEYIWHGPRIDNLILQEELQKNAFPQHHDFHHPYHL